MPSGEAELNALIPSFRLFPYPRMDSESEEISDYIHPAVITSLAEHEPIATISNTQTNPTEFEIAITQTNTTPKTQTNTEKASIASTPKTDTKAEAMVPIKTPEATTINKKKKSSSSSSSSTSSSSSSSSTSEEKSKHKPQEKETSKLIQKPQENSKNESPEKGTTKPEETLGVALEKELEKLKDQLLDAELSKTYKEAPALSPTPHDQVHTASVPSIPTPTPLPNSVPSLGQFVTSRENSPGSNRPESPRRFRPESPRNRPESPLRNRPDSPRNRPESPGRIQRIERTTSPESPVPGRIPRVVSTEYIKQSTPTFARVGSTESSKNETYKTITETESFHPNQWEEKISEIVKKESPRQKTPTPVIPTVSLETKSKPLPTPSVSKPLPKPSERTSIFKFLLSLHSIFFSLLSSFSFALFLFWVFRNLF